LSQQPEEAYKRYLPEAANKATFASIATCQGGEIGRRARLRIPKSSISKRSFSFQKMIDLREKNAIFACQSRLHHGRVKTSSF
jgi:hypothetical protein